VCVSNICYFYILNPTSVVHLGVLVVRINLGAHHTPECVGVTHTRVHKVTHTWVWV
jgi:hypothetical protein